MREFSKNWTNPVMGTDLIIFLAVSVLCPIRTRNIAPVIESDQVLFQNGHPSSNLNYRIPVIAIGPLNHTLVAVVEQISGGTSTTLPVNIVYRYSEDFGTNW